MTSPLFPAAFRRAGLAVATLPLLLAALGTALAATPASLEIRPGPRSMTAEERSLSASPSSGSQHGLVLLEESERDDRAGNASTLLFRLRAKIFSGEGRDLANVEIPYDTGTVLKEWWGWTLLPDGRVLELPREELHEQAQTSWGREEVAVLKGALRGVVPGSVIEYGYRIQEGEPPWRRRVELQGPLPIREFRYHWFPYERRVASARITRGEGLTVNLVSDSRSVLVTGKDLPAVVEEPYMPPLPEVRAAVFLYYRPAAADPKTFWTHLAKKLDRQAATFAPSGFLKSTLAGMDLPAGDDLGAKLRAVLAWMSAHIEVTNLLSSEQAEGENPQGRKTEFFARDVLKSGRAKAWQAVDLFLGFARALGAEAHLVLATDRTDRFFDPSLLSTSQFDWGLVALHPPGSPPDQLDFVDPVIGLPYGEIPWWIAGASGFLADPKEAKTVLLQPSAPLKSLSESQTSLTLHPENGTASARWSRTDTGQAGLRDRLRLRDLAPEARQKQLELMCGSDVASEMTRAEAPGLQDLSGGLKLECEETLGGIPFPPGAGTLALGLEGPWEEPVPELTAATRVHPVVFQYPRIDRNVLDIATPPGYATSAPTAVAPIESPFGQYALFISATPKGYHVERVFSLTTIQVPVSEYGPLREFLAKVRQADHTSVLFRKKEEE